MHFYKWVFRFYLVYLAYQLLALTKQNLRDIISQINKTSNAADSIDLRSPHEIYAPHGCFIIFHRSYFDAGGSLDHGAFLFGEEVFVAETARRLGVKVSHDPRLGVIHHEHMTTGRFKNRRLARYSWEASKFCADEFFK